MFRKIGFTLFLVLFFSLISPGETEASQIYQVRPGDSLWGIARQWNVSVEMIKTVNNLANDEIKIGQALTIPDNSSVVSSETTTTNSFSGIYRVQGKDSLFSIASRWGVSVESIKSANGLTSDTIHPGQVLVIPNSSSRGALVRDTRKRMESLPTPSIQRLTSGNISEIIQKYLGTPYVYGGCDPSVGFDCSGFTLHVYSLLGVRLPRTSYDQYTVGVDVPREQLSQGDLVFFNTGGGVSHVGIYLGEDNFAHASASRGVTIDNLNGTYWTSRYVGAKRVI